jgi:hypothetical protein
MFDISLNLELCENVLAIFEEILGEDSVEIGGVCGHTNAENMIVHLLVRDPVTTLDMLEDADVPVQAVRPVLVIEIEGLPKRLGEILMSLSLAEVDIEFFYLNDKNQLVLGVENVNRGIHALLTHLIRSNKDT